MYRSELKNTSDLTNCNFLIKGLEHHIKDDKWTTDLIALTVPKIPKKKVEDSRKKDYGYYNKDEVTAGGNKEAIKCDMTLEEILNELGYKEGEPIYHFALAQFEHEGWDPRANRGIGSAAYRNNNPGNLNFYQGLDVIDPTVSMEKGYFGNAPRFAHFKTCVLGAKAYIELKLKRWATGKMPPTPGNSKLLSQRGYKEWKGGEPTLREYMYTYTPPSEKAVKNGKVITLTNKTEGYIQTILDELKNVEGYGTVLNLNWNANTKVIDIIELRTSSQVAATKESRKKRDDLYKATGFTLL